MNSPSVQINGHAEPSMFDLDGPPSSPFITEVETNAANSRNPSKQFSTSLTASSRDSPSKTGTLYGNMDSPSKEDVIDFTDFMEDKENVPSAEVTTTKISFTPRKATTPEPVSRQEEKQDRNPVLEERRSSNADAELMPPPSIRKTPKKTPLRSLRDGTTPRPISRGKSTDRVEPTPARTPSQFQAGLDARTPLQDTTNVDDTCFSTFSEIPEMTLFAKLGQSPTKRGDFLRTPGRDDASSKTPRTSRKRLSDSISRSPSPTPRRQKTPALDGNDTLNLIDFTQQIEGVTRPSASTSPAKSSTEPNLLKFMNAQRSPAKPTARHSMMPATPGKQSNLMSLLDFELPPAPTPRSVPTITVRELESLKSSYLSQISSLRATLSGREAEVESLKRAVTDAERRAGEAQEHVREEKSKREHAEQEKAGWERRGQEVETVLKSVKDEVLKGEAEKEDLIRKVEDSERRVEDAETRAVKAEERFADALAARATDNNGDSSVQEQVDRLVAVQIDAKIEAVSRELHGVYKDKHERKVATLKKSYEARSERKMIEMQTRLEALEKENLDLHAAKDATFSGPIASSAEADAELKARLEEQKAHLARLEHEMQTSQSQQAQLVRELEQERIEKGDLVAAVDEMLALQLDAASAQNSAAAGPSAQVQGAMSMVEDFRKSISRPASGLKPPGAGAESRIGRGGASGIGRAPTGGKSRMLANIERMGRAGGGAAAE